MRIVSFCIEHHLIILPHNALLAGGATTFCICVLLVATQGMHGRWSDDEHHGVQKVHTKPTPRVAGIALFLGLLVSIRFTPPEVGAVLYPTLLASLPAFSFGLLEDLTKKVGVRERLLATIASGIVAWWITHISLNRVGVWGLDYLLAFPLLSMLFTAFAIGGIANAINIIDGFNGLASGVVTISLSAIGIMAYTAGDAVLAKVCVVLVAVIAGFMVTNFPFGKIFLGDGGAYQIGFWLGWVAVLLPMRNPSISPWASLLACAYPILEVLFSIWRRAKRDLHPGSPDRLHMHSLIKTRLVRKWLHKSLPASLRNAAVAPVLWGFASWPAILAIAFAKTTWVLMICFGVSAVAYALYYRRLTRFGWGR